MHIQEYVFYGILLFLVVRYLYICIKYPFWAHMPVYHTYDYHNYFASTCREMQLFPYKNKYTNAIQVKTISYYELNDTYIKYFAELLQCFYIPSDTLLYTIVEKDVRARMVGHFDTPFISFYNEKNYVSTAPTSEKQFDILNTSVEIQLFPEPKGCIASYPVHIFYRDEYKSANYYTFIACERASTTINRNLISTHDYNSRRHNPNVRVGLLKKYVGICEGVVPLIEFSTGLYHIITNKTKQRMKNIVEVYRQNWGVMFDLLLGANSLYDFVVRIDVGAVKARIEAEILFVYAVCERGNVLAMYFIEDAHTLYEQTTEKTVRLVASINNGLTDELFYQGFLECFRKLQKRNLDFKRLLVDNIGHNSIVANQMPGLVEETAGAYYFINWLFPHKLQRENVFIFV